MMYMKWYSYSISTQSWKMFAIVPYNAVRFISDNTLSIISTPGNGLYLVQYM
jgi:hypothetical protein